MPSLARKRIEDEQEIADSQPMPVVQPVQDAQPNTDVEQTSDVLAAAGEQPELTEELEAVSEELEVDEEERESEGPDSDVEGPEDEDDDEEDLDDDADDKEEASSEQASSEQAEPQMIQAADPQGGDETEAVSDAHQLPQGRPDEMRILEALLFASKEPIDEKILAQRLPAGVELQPVLALLREEYAHRGVNLVRVNGKWTFRTASDLAWLMTREAVQPRKLSRAAVETLAVIAYHQPVTRAEIEDIRGVSISKGTLDVLLETGWIKPRGRRKVPGRPITYGTTEAFISHFGLEQLGDLPGLDELKGSGMLDGHLPPNFSVPMPSDDPTLREDEDPLEPGDLDFGLAPRVENTEE
jgi:segregation and condensation protein B